MEEAEERKLLLRRLFYSDRDLFEVGKDCGIDWFNQFEKKFAKDLYAYFSDEERKIALEKLATEPNSQAFVQAVNKVFGKKPRYLEIDRFVGEHFYFDGKEVKLEDRREWLKEEVRKAIKETKGRAVYFLRAIISLYPDFWDKAYGGASWDKILAAIRSLGGTYPSPRDLAILKSYGIYFKTGSRRYPTHTVPEEMIPVIKEVLLEEIISSKGK